jgi:hypothetical protein
MFDGDKPNSVEPRKHSRPDDHSSHPAFAECPMTFRRSETAATASWCDDTRGLIGPAALPLFCLAPHGVFRASRIASRAVSSYLAFSPLPAPFSKNRRYVFCDTFRQRPSGPRGTNIARVFYAACCRMVFGLSSSKSRQRATYQRSSAIGREFSTKNPNLEARKPRMLRLMLDVEVGRAVLCAPRSLGIGVHGVPALPIPSL